VQNLKIKVQNEYNFSTPFGRSKNKILLFELAAAKFDLVENCLNFEF